MKTNMYILVMCLFLVFLFLPLLSCCKLLVPQDEKLTLLRQDYVGNELRIDGYYYSPSSYNTSIYFLFNNGTLYYGGSMLPSYISEQERRWVNGEYIKNSITKWGVYLIEDSIIKFEKWYPSSPNEAVPTYIREGKILNDSTFHITKSYRGNGAELNIIDEMYYFKQFSPKPDSTNVFIK